MTPFVGDPTERVLAVDVCGTLYFANTSAGLVSHHHQRVGNRWRALFINLISSRILLLAYFCVAVAKVTGYDLHRAMTIFSLKGEKKVSLDASAKSYLNTLSSQRISVVHDRIRTMQNEGWSPVVVSNSIDTIVKPIADELGASFVSSQLGWCGERCTGRLAVDLTGNKLGHLERFLNRKMCMGRFSVITDNKSDADLVAVACNPILVAHGAPRFWMRKENVEILSVG